MLSSISIALSGITVIRIGLLSDISRLISLHEHECIYLFSSLAYRRHYISFYASSALLWDLYPSSVISSLISAHLRPLLRPITYLWVKKGAAGGGLERGAGGGT